jgi:hypothetical protein
MHIRHIRHSHVCRGPQLYMPPPRLLSASSSTCGAGPPLRWAALLCQLSVAAMWLPPHSPALNQKPSAVKRAARCAVVLLMCHQHQQHQLGSSLHPRPPLALQQTQGCAGRRCCCHRCQAAVASVSPVPRETRAAEALPGGVRLPAACTRSSR